MKNKQLLRYMSRVFLTFFFAIGVPVAVLTSFYLSTILAKQQDQEYQQYYRFVRQDVEAVSVFMERTVEFTSLMNRSAHLWEVQNNSYRDSVYSYRQLLELMDTFCENSGVKAKCALFIGHSQKVLSTHMRISSLEQYPDSPQVQHFLEQKKSPVFKQSGKELLVMTTLPKYYFDDSIVFLFYIDMDALFAPRDDSDCYVISPEGETLFGQNISESVLSQLQEQMQVEASGSFACENSTVWYQREPYSGLAFVRVYNTAHFQSMILKTIFVATTTILGSLLCVCGIAFLLARQYVKPVQKLSKQVEQLPQENKAEIHQSNIFDAISQSLVALQAQNESYSASVRQNQKIVEAQAIRDLLWSRLPVGYSIEEFLQEKGVAFTGKTITPLLTLVGVNLAKNKFSQISEVNILVKQVLEEYFSEKHVFVGSCLLELDQIVLLLNSEMLEEQNISMEHIVLEIAAMLQRKMGVQIKAATGYPVETAEDLCQQFIEIRRQIHKSGENKKEIIVVKKPGNTQAQLSPYLRTSLLSAIRSGEQEYVKETLNRIFALQQEMTDKTAAENHVFAIMGSVMAHLYDSPVEIPTEALDFMQVFTRYQDVQQREKIIVEKLLIITDCFALSNIEGEDSAYVSNAKEYIKHNIEKDISLTDIAQHIGINVSYFSRIFKASTGLTPLQYITNLRIEKAKEMLETDRLTVKEIAEALGYNDTRSFIRFFKKLENCTPTDYRAQATHHHETEREDG